MTILDLAKYRTLSLVFLLTICYPHIAWSQDDNRDVAPAMTASLDRPSAEVGGIVVLTLTYRLPKGAQLSPGPEIKGLEDVTVLQQITGPDRIKINILVDKLASWKTGPLVLTYLDKEGKAQRLTADPISVSVLSNLGHKPEEAQLKELQGIILTSPFWQKHLLWTTSLLGLSSIIFGVVWWLRRRQKKFSTTTQVLPHVLARREIEALEAQRLFETGQVKPFYFRLSEILRQYLESLRGFPAAEYTTEEISHRIDSEEDRTLLPLLREADLVKFADRRPTPARKDEWVKSALTYIQVTSPVPETDASTDAPKEEGI